MYAILIKVKYIKTSCKNGFVSVCVCVCETGVCDTCVCVCERVQMSTENQGSEECAPADVLRLTTSEREREGRERQS